jgi:hypothetical protein
MIREFVKSSKMDNKFWLPENRHQILSILKYVISDGNFSELEGIRLVPLSNQTFQFFARQREKIYLTKDEDVYQIFQNKMSASFVDIKIDASLLDSLIEISKKCTFFNLFLLDSKSIPQIIKENYFGSSNSEEFRFDKFVTESWIDTVWNYLNRNDVDLSLFENLQLLKVRKHFLVKLKKAQNSSTIDLQQNVNPEMLEIFEKVGCYFVEINPMRSDLSKKYLHNSSHFGILSAVCSLSCPSFPNDSQSKILLRDYLSNCDFSQLLSNKQIFQNTISKFPIFETSKREFVSLQNQNNSLFFPPKNYPHITHPNLVKRFDNDSQLLKFLQIKTMEMSDFFLRFFLEMIDYYSANERDELNKEMLLNMNQLILDSNFKSKLETIKFIPDIDSNLKNPKNLFDPNEEVILLLYEKNEPFFPHPSYQSREVINQLKLLQLKSKLTVVDLIERAQSIQ